MQPIALISRLNISGLALSYINFCTNKCYTKKWKPDLLQYIWKGGFKSITLYLEEEFSNASDFQILAQLEEHGISTYKFAFTPGNSKDKWMCDLAPFAVVGSNTIIQVNVADHLDHDHADYVNHADNI